MSEDLILEKPKEAMALIVALTPQQAPDDLLLIKGATGLNIIKNEYVPDGTIIVSKRLFDMIFNASEQNDQPR